MKITWRQIISPLWTLVVYGQLLFCSTPLFADDPPTAPLWSGESTVGFLSAKDPFVDSHSPVNPMGRVWTPDWTDIDSKADFFSSVVDAHPNILTNNVQFGSNSVGVFNEVPEVLRRLGVNANSMEVGKVWRSSTAYTSAGEVTYDQKAIEKLKKTLIEKIEELPILEFENFQKDLEKIKAASKHDGEFKKKLLPLLHLAPFLYDAQGVAVVKDLVIPEGRGMRYESGPTAKRNLIRQIKYETSPSDFENRLLDMNEQHFRSLIESMLFEEVDGRRVKKKGFGAAKVAYDGFKRKFLDNLVKRAVKQRVQGSDNVSFRRISIEEIPAAITPLAGNFGPNCTVCSGPYKGLVKGVKKYWIRKNADHRGKPGGYVTVADVVVDGEVIPYFLEVDGPHLTQEDAEMAMHLISRRYSTDDGIFPDFDRPGTSNFGLVNHEHFRKAMRRGAKKTKVEVEMPQGWDALESHRAKVPENYDYSDYFHSSNLKSAYRAKVPKPKHFTEPREEVVDSRYAAPETLSQADIYSRAFVAYQLGKSDRTLRERVKTNYSLEDSHLKAVEILLSASHTSPLTKETLKAVESIGIEIHDLHRLGALTFAASVSKVHEEDPRFLSEEKWNTLFDRVHKEIEKTLDDTQDLFWKYRARWELPGRRVDRAEELKSLWEAMRRDPVKLGEDVPHLMERFLEDVVEKDKPGWSKLLRARMAAAALGSHNVQGMFNKTESGTLVRDYAFGAGLETVAELRIAEKLNNAEFSNQALGAKDFIELKERLGFELDEFLSFRPMWAAASLKNLLLSPEAQEHFDPKEIERVVQVTAGRLEASDFEGDELTHLFRAKLQLASDHYSPDEELLGILRDEESPYRNFARSAIQMEGVPGSLWPHIPELIENNPSRYGGEKFIEMITGAAVPQGELTEELFEKLFQAAKKHGYQETLVRTLLGHDENLAQFLLLGGRAGRIVRAELTPRGAKLIHGRKEFWHELIEKTKTSPAVVDALIELQNRDPSLTRIPGHLRQSYYTNDRDSLRLFSYQANRLANMIASPSPAHRDLGLESCRECKLPQESRQTAIENAIPLLWHRNINVAKRAFKMLKEKLSPTDGEHFADLLKWIENPPQYHAVSEDEIQNRNDFVSETKTELFRKMGLMGGVPPRLLRKAIPLLVSHQEAIRENPWGVPLYSLNRFVKGLDQTLEPVHQDDARLFGTMGLGVYMRLRQDFGFGLRNLQTFGHRQIPFSLERIYDEAVKRSEGPRGKRYRAIVNDPDWRNVCVTCHEKLVTELYELDSKRRSPEDAQHVTHAIGYQIHLPLAQDKVVNHIIGNLNLPDHRYAMGLESFLRESERWGLGRKLPFGFYESMPEMLKQIPNANAKWTLSAVASIPFPEDIWKQPRTIMGTYYDRLSAAVRAVDMEENFSRLFFNFSVNVRAVLLDPGEEADLLLRRIFGDETVDVRYSGSFKEGIKKLFEQGDDQAIHRMLDLLERYPHLYDLSVGLARARFNGSHSQRIVDMIQGDDSEVQVAALKVFWNKPRITQGRRGLLQAMVDQARSSNGDISAVARSALTATALPQDDWLFRDLLDLVERDPNKKEGNDSYYLLKSAAGLRGLSEGQQLEIVGWVEKLLKKYPKNGFFRRAGYLMEAVERLDVISPKVEARLLKVFKKLNLRSRDHEPSPGLYGTKLWQDIDAMAKRRNDRDRKACDRVMKEMADLI